MKRALLFLAALVCALPAWAGNPMMAAAPLSMFQIQAVANFAHYANGSIVGGNFTNGNSAASGTPTVTSGVLHASATGEIETAIWGNTAVFNPNQIVSVVVGSLTASGDAAGAVLRASGGNTGYLCFVGGPTGASAYYAIAKIVSGSFSFIVSATTMPAALSAGDIISCRVSDTTIELDWLRSGQATVALSVITDSNIATGTPGVYIQAGAATANSSVTEVVMGNWLTP